MHLHRAKEVPVDASVLISWAPRALQDAAKPWSGSERHSPAEGWTNPLQFTERELSRS